MSRNDTGLPSVQGERQLFHVLGTTGISLVLVPHVVSPFLVVLSKMSPPLALTIQIAGTQGPTQTAAKSCESPKSKGAPGGDGNPPCAEGAPNSS